MGVEGDALRDPLANLIITSKRRTLKFNRKLCKGVKFNRGIAKRTPEGRRREGENIVGLAEE